MSFLRTSCHRVPAYVLTIHRYPPLHFSFKKCKGKVFPYSSAVFWLAFASCQAFLYLGMRTAGMSSCRIARCSRMNSLWKWPWISFVSSRCISVLIIRKRTASVNSFSFQQTMFFRKLRVKSCILLRAAGTFIQYGNDFQRFADTGSFSFYQMVSSTPSRTITGITPMGAGTVTV